MNEISKQVLSVRIFAKALKYGGYERRLASMVYKVFDKKTSGSGTKNENISNIELAEELHKPIITKLHKRKAHSPFIDNIWGTDLADLQLISKINSDFYYV